ncbi:hypothetical protein SAMN05660420_00433 [Desulfuromusa kysingii]|uniref:Uncharacterized protein n=1 Tax=Desulfuromusa kysingii TaxID=37625 RepID=A0A1H3W450_9BACT|nr:hypothetical protein [Desulfuromusa kysingii]SDZ81214.1 hypothetical protein SAMN05660420_00433 [Desulfuromusa kysingii]
MNCPYCNHHDHLEVDLHADGFSSNLLECTECGAMLVDTGSKLATVHGPDKQSGVAGKQSKADIAPAETS